MRHGFNSSVRGLAAIAVVLALSGSVAAAPREKVDWERDRKTSIVKIVKRIIQSLGDGLTVPIGKP